MADDLVTRLRAHLVRRDMTAGTHHDGCIDSHPICALAWALDEIERLRSALEVAADRMSMTGAPQAIIDAMRKAARSK